MNNNNLSSEQKRKLTMLFLALAECLDLNVDNVIAREAIQPTRAERSQHDSVDVSNLQTLPRNPKYHFIVNMKPGDKKIVNKLSNNERLAMMQAVHGHGKKNDKRFKTASTLDGLMIVRMK